MFGCRFIILYHGKWVLSSFPYTSFLYLILNIYVWLCWVLVATGAFL